jgi:RsiW-degrading membrane proteinase PrsW (M82 family)
MDPDREPLSPRAAAQSDARGAHNINVQDPAYNKGVQPTKGFGQAGPQQGHEGPRAFYAGDTAPDKLDYVSMLSMIGLIGAMIALLATKHYVGVVFMLGLFVSFVIAFLAYNVGPTRHSVRVNHVVRNWWLGVLFALPVCVLEGIIVQRWWYGGGQIGYTNGNSSPMRIGWAIAAGCFLSFLLYGWFQNTLHYLIIRAHYNRAIFYTPYGLPLIGLSAGLGFAFAEYVLYILLYGFTNACVRGLISFPFFATMGLIMGTIIARHKYLQPEGQPLSRPGFGLYLKAIILPFILTGMFELPFVVIFMAHRFYGYWSFWFLGSLGVLLISLIIYWGLSRPLTRSTVFAPKAQNQTQFQTQPQTQFQTQPYQTQIP